ncbi:MAG: hypothetical protein LiPW15_664 [Parcubacteria group bacterium LiPW_15]|nr:MAG: hypothetical protein LiPW15_664 [Parcubacteria group bacterium LiPW_15]
MSTKPLLVRVCPKCYLALGKAETACRVDEKTIEKAEKAALGTKSDDALFRFSELARIGENGGLHKLCAEQIAHALLAPTEKCSPDLATETLARQTAKELCHPS